LECQPLPFQRWTRIDLRRIKGASYVPDVWANARSGYANQFDEGFVNRGLEAAQKYKQFGAKFECYPEIPISQFGSKSRARFNRVDWRQFNGFLILYFFGCQSSLLYV